MSITAEIAIEKEFDSIYILTPEDTFFHSASVGVPTVFVTPESIIIKKFDEVIDIYIPTDYLIGCSMVSKEMAVINFRRRLEKTLDFINGYISPEEVLVKKLYTVVDFFSYSEKDPKMHESIWKSYFYGERFGIVYELKDLGNLKSKYDECCRVDNMIVGE